MRISMHGTENAGKEKERGRRCSSTHCSAVPAGVVDCASEVQSTMSAGIHTIIVVKGTIAVSAGAGIAGGGGRH